MLFKHYKGTDYYYVDTVLYVTGDAERRLVIYKNDANEMFARDWEDFFSTVDTVPRFSLCPEHARLTMPQASDKERAIILASDLGPAVAKLWNIPTQ